MLQWAVTFLVIALVAALVGFGGLAAVSMEAARIVAGVFLVMFVVTALMHALKGKTPPV